MLWSELNEEETNKMIKKALNHIEKNSEHSLSWQELKEEAKKMGYYLVKKIPYEKEVDCLVNDNGYAFYREGTCEFDCNPNDNLCGQPFTDVRTPDQMLAIMKALQ